MASAKSTRTVHRSAVNGQFAKEKDAAKKPREYVKEKVPLPAKKK